MVDQDTWSIDVISGFIAAGMEARVPSRHHGTHFKTRAPLIFILPVRSVFGRNPLAHACGIAP